MFAVGFISLALRATKQKPDWQHQNYKVHGFSLRATSVFAVGPLLGHTFVGYGYFSGPFVAMTCRQLA